MSGSGKVVLLLAQYSSAFYGACDSIRSISVSMAAPAAVRVEVRAVQSVWRKELHRSGVRNFIAWYVEEWLTRARCIDVKSVEYSAWITHLDTRSVYTTKRRR